jgi:DNA-binding response OmpR family regulator
MRGVMDTTTKRVLVVEDDSSVRELLTQHLQESGFTVTETLDGRRGCELALTDAYDLVILDVALPGKDGLEICRTLRAKGVRAAVMMLTTRGAEIDKVLGFELGADDYVTKPFSVREVVVRAKALIRRTSGEEMHQQKRLEAGDFKIDLDSHEAFAKGYKLDLTSTEFDLLTFFLKNVGRTFSREQLLNSVWGYSSSAYEHTVNTHINRLRAKIEPDPASPSYIQTVWGVGYKFVGRSDARVAA